jgi:hypothetical protein
MSSNKKNSKIKIIEKDDIEEKDITTKLVEQRNERQEINNNNAYNAIKENSKKPNKDKINENALERLLTFTEYTNLEEIKKDKDNLEDNIMKITALYIAINASRQGTKDEGLQLDNINILQDYGITICKDGKQKPIKGGGIRKAGKKQADELKTIDFLIKHDEKEIGYITAKVTSGEGGHQDNVLDEITQYCDWALIQQNKDIGKKCYVVLYDSNNTSNLINDIKKKYKNDNLIITNTKNFKTDFINWFNNIYKKK